MNIFGIDVSRHNGNINWSKVAQSGVKFAIIKAGGSDDGFYKDPKFEYNYTRAFNCGLGVGAYYFVGPKCKSREDGIADAHRFYQIISGKKFDYPVFIDFEAPSAYNKSGNTEAVIGFCEYMESKGYYCGVYASTLSGFDDKLIDTKLKPYDHWVADYRGYNGYKGSTGIWQYSETGKISGISKKTDLDYAYKNYPSIIKRKHLNGW